MLSPFFFWGFIGFLLLLLFPALLLEPQPLGLQALQQLELLVSVAAAGRAALPLFLLFTLFVFALFFSAG